MLLIFVLHRRKILSADTEAVHHHSGKDEALKNEFRVSEVDSTCDSSTNSSLQKHDNSDACVKSAENGHIPNLDSSMLDTNCSTAETLATSSSVLKTDVDSVSGGDDIKSDVADDANIATECSAVESKMDEGTDAMLTRVNETCNNANAEAKSTAVVCNDSEDRTAETCSDQTSSGEGQEQLQSTDSAPPPHRDDPVDKIATESASGAVSDLSPSLMNEVNRCYKLCKCFSTN